MNPAILLALLVTSLSAGTLTCDAVCLGKVASVTTISVNALDPVMIIKRRRVQ